MYGLSPRVQVCSTGLVPPTSNLKVAVGEEAPSLRVKRYVIVPAWRALIVHANRIVDGQGPVGLGMVAEPVAISTVSAVVELVFDPGSVLDVVVAANVVDVVDAAWVVGASDVVPGMAVVVEPGDGARSGSTKGRTAS